MFPFKMLPWEYGIRNLFRRPLRSLLTFAALTTVILLVFVVVGYFVLQRYILPKMGVPT